MTDFCQESGHFLAEITKIWLSGLEVLRGCAKVLKKPLK